MSSMPFHAPIQWVYSECRKQWPPACRAVSCCVPSRNGPGSLAATASSEPSKAEQSHLLLLLLLLLLLILLLYFVHLLGA